MCTSPISRIPVGTRATTSGCLLSGRSSQSSSATDLSCHPSTDVCLLCAAIPSISSTAGNVLIERMRMKPLLVIHQAMIAASMIHESHTAPCNESPSVTAVVVAPFKWPGPLSGSVTHTIIYHSFSCVSSSLVCRMILCTFISALRHLNSRLLLDSFI